MGDRLVEIHITVTGMLLAYGFRLITIMLS